MEKYEIFRARNETLEKVALQKEKLYNEIKISYDNTSQQLFVLQKKYEEVRNTKDILDIKVKKLEETTKMRDEQLKLLKIQKEKFEGQSRVLVEQVQIIQGSHDELSYKKN